MNKPIASVAVHACAVHAREGAQGLRLFVDGGGTQFSIDLPDDVVRQVLRTVGQNDTHRMPQDITEHDAGVMVHPVSEWRVAPLDAFGMAAIQMTDVRGMGGAYAFCLDELEAIHNVIGDLVLRLQRAPAGWAPPSLY